MRLLHITIYIIATVCFQSCSADDETTLLAPNDDEEQPFTLSGFHIGGGIQLDWVSIEDPTFEEYIIVRSLDSIPDSPEPPTLVPNYTMFRIPFQYQTTYTDVPIFSTFDPLHDVYYKAYVKTANGYTSSPTIKVATISKELPTCARQAIHIPNSNHLLLVDYEKILKYDYIEHLIIAEGPLNNHFNQIRIGDAGNGMEIFEFSKTHDDIYVLDINDFSLKDSKNVGGRVYDVAVSDKGYLFLSIDNSNYSLRMFNRQGLQSMNLLNEQDHSEERRLIISPQDDNRLIEISGPEISVYDFTDNGNFFTLDNTFTSPANRIVKRNITVSANGDYFIPYEKATMFRTINPSEKIEIEVLSHCHYLDSDNNYLYYHNIESVIRYDMESQEYKTMFTSFLRTDYIFDTGDQILLISNTPTGTSSPRCGYITSLEK